MPDTTSANRATLADLEDADAFERRHVGTS